MTLPGDDGTGMSMDTISDSAVVDSPGWGFVNHSSNVAISGNVAYNVTGAAYATEAGDETGSFTGNIAIRSQGSGVGIRGMRERLRQFHGTLRIESDSSGTRISATIPLPESEENGVEPMRAAV